MNGFDATIEAKGAVQCNVPSLLDKLKAGDAEAVALVTCTALALLGFTLLLWPERKKK